MKTSDPVEARTENVSVESKQKDDGAGFKWGKKNKNGKNLK